MVIGVAIAPWGSISQETERREGPTSFTVKVPQLRQIRSNHLSPHPSYLTHFTPALNGLTSHFRLCCLFHVPSYSMVSTCWWPTCVFGCTHVQMAGLCSLATGARTHTLTSLAKYWLCPVLHAHKEKICTETRVYLCGCKKDESRGGGEDKEVLIYQHNAEPSSTVGQVQGSKVTGVSEHKEWTFEASWARPPWQ